MQLLASDITACPVCGALLWMSTDRRNYEKHRQWHINQNEVVTRIFASIHAAATETGSAYTGAVDGVLPIEKESS